MQLQLRVCLASLTRNGSSDLASHLHLRRTRAAIRPGPSPKQCTQFAPNGIPQLSILCSHSSYSDLFFDLLFAACLNTYSNAVNLAEFAHVAVFLGYFLALWWAWWSQAYFDVRYRQPSPYYPFYFKMGQRFMRVAVLGIWVGFSTTPSEFSRGSFKNLSLIYGCSRMALALDHTVVLLFDLGYWHMHPSPPQAQRLEAQNDHAHEPSQISETSIHAPNKSQRNAIIWIHLASIAALSVSGVLWICTRFVTHQGVTGSVLALWFVGVGVEMSVQILSELSGVLSILGDSVLPERLVLFGLIILGEGFTGIAETLNRMSPGAKEKLNGVSIESGGWGGDTILQAVSCVLIVVLQFSGYFHRATSQVEMPSVFVVVWAYIHVILHMSSALLVVGLKRILGAANTVNGIIRFLTNPSLYLPDGLLEQTPGYNADEPRYKVIDTPLFPFSENGTIAAIASVFAVLQSNEGASIPTLPQAQALVGSVVSLVGGMNQTLELVAETNRTGASDAVSERFPPSLVLPFKSYFELADNVINPNSLGEYILKSLFHFKYIYAASAVYLAVDIAIKAMQNPRDRKLRSFRWAMALRLAFASLLAVLQVVFTSFGGIPSSAALNGALAICAAVLLAELIAQQIVDYYKPRLDTRQSRLGFPSFGKTDKAAKTAPPSQESASLSHKDSEQQFEMHANPSSPDHEPKAL